MTTFGNSLFIGIFISFEILSHINNKVLPSFKSTLILQVFSATDQIVGVGRGGGVFGGPGDSSSPHQPPEIWNATQARSTPNNDEVLLHHLLR